MGATPSPPKVDPLATFPSEPDPDLRVWSAPTGVLASPDGIRASFRALRFRVELAPIPDGIAFEAWKQPRLAGALVAALLAVLILFGAQWAGLDLIPTFGLVILVSLLIPTALAPAYRVSGRITRGNVRLRIEAKGLFSRKDLLERRLRFYLERAS